MIYDIVDLFKMFFDDISKNVFGFVANVHLTITDRCPAGRGWIQEMTVNGETTRRLCDELSQQMSELISQARPRPRP